MKNNARFLIPFTMALVNSAGMSLIMCILNVGFGPHFLGEFIKSLLIGMIVTLPVSYVLPSFLNKFLDTDNDNE